MRLLLVEDNEELARLLIKGLRAAGYEIDRLAAAAEARLALRTTRYAVLILDLGLPDGDGLSILREIRHRKDPLPVLVLSARGGVHDRVGGLRTILWASGAQAAAMAGFLVTQNEIGLFTISAVFGFGFGGLIPGYVLAVRELFPASEASWRIPTMMFPGSLGMAMGGWLAGAIYDRTGSYAAALVNGIAWNMVNMAIAFWLLQRMRRRAADASALSPPLIGRTHARTG